MSGSDSSDDGRTPLVIDNGSGEWLPHTVSLR